jgi:UDP-N-acetylglucosamine--N-acetylmuramyl-(pentapeptide) pyrophosphoryl-undecaprenol N-acetylglucosamine transferase
VPDAQVTFVGTARGLESTVVPREGFPLDLIRSAGLKGKSLASLVRGVLLLPVSARDAWRVISRRAPAVVVGVGGYSSGPVVALAALRGIPTLVMEQNASPGLTNRILARLVRAAAVTFEASLPRFGRKAFVSGNPVRAEFFERPAEPNSGRPRVLVFGGSQGAHAINMAMVDAAIDLATATPAPHVTHQTGQQDLAEVRAAYARAGFDARVEPFLFAMHEEMQQADVVVCRAGATTLAELAAAAKPSILIPLPTATDDHQRANAKAVALAGAAIVLDQRDLSGRSLARAVTELTADAGARERMSRAAASLARPRAAADIADRILALAGVAA